MDANTEHGASTAKHRHPFGRVVRVEEGRSLLWLARQLGVSHAHVRAVSAGIERPSPRFRARCAAVLGRREDELFHGASGAAAPGASPAANAIDDRDCTVVDAIVPAGAGARL